MSTKPMMDRKGFLGAVVGLAAAPAVHLASEHVDDADNEAAVRDEPYGICIRINRGHLDADAVADAVVRELERHAERGGSVR